MTLTFVDICVLIGTLGFHWQVGSYFYLKIKSKSEGFNEPKGQ
jgi:hypothetical protein